MRINQNDLKLGGWILTACLYFISTNIYAQELPKIVVAHASYQNVSEGKNSDVRAKLTAERIVSTLTRTGKYEVIAVDTECDTSDCLKQLATNYEALTAISANVVEDYGDFSFSLITTNQSFDKKELLSYSRLQEELEKLILEEIDSIILTATDDSSSEEPSNGEMTNTDVAPVSNQQSYDNYDKRLKKLKLGLGIGIGLTSGFLVTTIIVDLVIKSRIDQMDNGRKDLSYIHKTENLQTVAQVFGISTIIGAGISAVLAIKLHQRKKEHRQVSLEFSPIFTPQMNGVLLQGRF